MRLICTFRTILRAMSVLWRKWLSFFMDLGYHRGEIMVPSHVSSLSKFEDLFTCFDVFTYCITKYFSCIAKFDRGFGAYILQRILGAWTIYRKLCWITSKLRCVEPIQRYTANFVIILLAGQRIIHLGVLRLSQPERNLIL